MTLSQWDKVADEDITDGLLHKLSTWHLSESERCSTASDIDNLIRNNNIGGIIEYNFRYDDLCNINASSVYHLRQVLAFYQKREDLDLGIDKEAVAYQKFVESETLCRETNAIFRLVHQGGFCFPPDVNSVLHTAQRKIAQVLGDLPEVSKLKFRFGPGATTQLTKRKSSARSKLSQDFACSKDLIPLLPEVLDELQGWVFRDEDPDSVSVPVVIHDGRLTFVPKNAKTFRGIVVEPSLNSFVQLGIGDYMSARLKRFGIDLTDQTRNQRLAREGSLTNALATLDLSSASDTVARLLVQDLLPYEWYDFLTKVSTSVVTYDEKRITLEKISSMGNGITFPLESLIFFALASACCSDEEQEFVSVYGDDIIIPSSRYGLLCKVLNAVGFIPNHAKSFSDGPFRESCGKDYLLGIDIRPVYIKNRVTGADAFILHNYYVRSGQPEPAAIVLSFISPDLRLWGPDGFGDGHLIGDYVAKRKKKHIKNGYGGHIFDTYTWKSRISYEVLPGDRVLPCYTIYANPAKAGLPGIKLNIFSSVLRNGPDRREAQKEFYDVAESSISYDRRGRMGVVNPGTAGYKRISIYTLNSPPTT